MKEWDEDPITLSDIDVEIDTYFHDEIKCEKCGGNEVVDKYYPKTRDSQEYYEIFCAHCGVCIC